MENQKSAPVYQVVEKFVSINGEGRRAGGACSIYPNERV